MSDMHAQRTEGKTIFLAPARNAGLRLLVAEDNPILQIGTRDLLESRWDLELHMVSDGEQAVRACSSIEFDLILMDLQMPVMDGFEATRRLRNLEAANPSRRRAAVVAYTSSSSEAIRAELQGSGIDAVLIKPAPPTAICACLHQWAAGKVRRRPDTSCDGAVNGAVPPRGAPLRG